ncbi:MAG: ORF6N domain-containing protein, partial [Candidatus Delongbacteria bacterium]|nr:ORF6N domain-containing protein [Candidatus Delongbacteria bacterium]
MLDRDLAELYGVETKRINEVVKRNKERFPLEFCFKLTISENTKQRSQFATFESRKAKYTKYLPLAFTEQGVAMLSAVLKSKTAVRISILIINSFVEMRKFIQSNAQVFDRLQNVDVKLLDHDQKFDKVFSALESNELIPKQGIFFEGQIFDAYKFVSDLFRSAKRSITIIDNYIDDTVLYHLSSKGENVKVKILTKSISDKLKLEIHKFEKQYFKIDVKVYKKVHDRFIIIDGNEIYHIGASIKDLGNKLFGFSKMDKTALNI